MYEIIGLIIMVLLLFHFLNMDWLGWSSISSVYFLFGNWHIAIPFFFIVFALIIMIKQSVPAWKNRLYWDLFMY